MAKDIRYHIYLRDKNSEADTPLNFVINKGTNRRKKRIDESIAPRYWDFEREEAIVSSNQPKPVQALCKRVNKKLARIKVEVDELLEEYVAIDRLTPNHTDGDYLFDELWDKIESIIDDSVEEEKQEAKKATVTPIEFFTKWIEKWSKTPNRRTGVVPSKDTIWNYNNTLRRYKDYISDNHIKDTFKVFDEDFQSDFDEYLLEEQELSMNTVCGSHSQLKTMLRQAYEKGYLKDSSFLHWLSKAITFSKVYLTDKELKDLYNLQITDEIRREHKVGEMSRIEETKDLFIISARTGLRYSDLCRLNAAEWEINGEEGFLHTTIQKTKDKIAIPLHREVISIYNKYNGILPKPVYKSHYNDQIRLCCKLVGMTGNYATFRWEKGKPEPITCQKWELVSSHTGRRSFATNLFLVCKSAQYVMSLTGHKTEENFKRYICVDQAEMAKIVKKYINLDPDVEDNTAYEKFIASIKSDALTIDNQRQKIKSLENTTKSQTQMITISDQINRSKDEELEEIKMMWGLGLSLEEYKEIKQEEEIALSATDLSSPEDFAD